MSKQQCQERRLKVDCNYSVLSTLLMNFLKQRNLWKKAKTLAKANQINLHKNYFIFVQGIALYIHEQLQRGGHGDPIGQIFSYIQRNVQGCIQSKYPNFLKEYKKLLKKKTKNVLCIFSRVFKQILNGSDFESIIRQIIGIYEKKGQRKRQNKYGHEIFDIIKGTLELGDKYRKSLIKKSQELLKKEEYSDEVDYHNQVQNEEEEFEEADAIQEKECNQIKLQLQMKVEDQCEGFPNYNKKMFNIKEKQEYDLPYQRDYSKRREQAQKKYKQKKETEEVSNGVQKERKLFNQQAPKLRFFSEQQDKLKVENEIKNSEIGQKLINQEDQIKGQYNQNYTIPYYIIVKAQENPFLQTTSDYWQNLEQEYQNRYNNLIFFNFYHQYQHQYQYQMGIQQCLKDYYVQTQLIEKKEEHIFQNQDFQSKQRLNGWKNLEMQQKYYFENNIANVNLSKLEQKLRILPFEQCQQNAAFVKKLKIQSQAQVQIPAQISSRKETTNMKPEANINLFPNIAEKSSYRANQDQNGNLSNFLLKK